MADKLVQQNFNEIIIDDGSVKVPIRNKHGEQIVEFSFRPTDIGIVDRFNSVAAEFDKIVEPLEGVIGFLFKERPLKNSLCLRNCRFLYGYSRVFYGYSNIG